MYIQLGEKCSKIFMNRAYERFIVPGPGRQRGPVKLKYAEKFFCKQA